MLAMLFGGFGILFLLMMLLFAVPLSIALTAFWIWMLVDCIQNKGLTDGEKIGWTLAIVFTHALGALIYLIAARSKRHTPLAAT